MYGKNTITTRIILQRLNMISRGIDRILIPYKRQVIFQYRGIKGTIRCVDHLHSHHQHTVGPCRCRQMCHLNGGLRKGDAVPYKRRVERTHHTVNNGYHIINLCHVDG